MKQSITVTGADERTSVHLLGMLAAEIGFLYTFDGEGRPRYPSREWIARALNSGHISQAALHVCGSRAREQLVAMQLDDITRAVDRIQVNGVLCVGTVVEICRRYPTQTIITQHTAANAELLAITEPNHSLLVDASGGRGMLPGEWTRPETHKPVGFAGGLGPDNLADQLERIGAIATGDWWVDMENSLRVNDWFSIERARQAVEQFHSVASA